MVNIENYMKQLISLLKCRFGSRLLYVGLQGSYLRGEATDNSDIDIMVIIDQLSVHDLDEYRSILQSLENCEKSCGFICSKSDLENWNPLEICNLLNSTKDYHGFLREYVPTYDIQDIRNYIKVSINNLYHEICHRYIHADTEKNISNLTNAYKAVFYILQNMYYLTHGRFPVTKAELLQVLDGMNYAVLKRSIDLSNGMSVGFQDSFELLFRWCQETLCCF